MKEEQVKVNLPHWNNTLWVDVQEYFLHNRACLNEQGQLQFEENYLRVNDVVVDDVGYYY
jgi:hypothetical protein